MERHCRRILPCAANDAARPFGIAGDFPARGSSLSTSRWFLGISAYLYVVLVLPKLRRGRAYALIARFYGDSFRRAIDLSDVKKSRASPIV